MFAASGQNQDRTVPGASGPPRRDREKENPRRTVRTQGGNLYHQNRIAALSSRPSEQIVRCRLHARSRASVRERMRFGRARRCARDSIVLAAKSSNARRRLAPKAAGLRTFASRQDRPTRAALPQVEAAMRDHMDARSWHALRHEDSWLPARDFLPLGSARAPRVPPSQTARQGRSEPTALEANARERKNASRSIR